MELQLKKQPIQCLRTAVREVQSQEQTQEIRITDGMPDIGTIVGAWGQVILRGKEWDSDSIRISGGTMVWVQYLSEDGTQTAGMESWLPFQMQWKLPPSDGDTKICCQSFLKSVDVRSTSARKMMIRTDVALLTEGLESCSYDVYYPENLPDDVNILTQSYPVQLPVEAGEKAFTLDELLPLPAECPSATQIHSYALQTEVTEEKLMGDKLVFRGKAYLHVHYSGEEGTQHSCDLEIPFSQYCELEREYTKADTTSLWPCVTSLEAELQQEQIHLKAGLVCQYRICSQSILEIVTDAYSNKRNVECVKQPLELPVILESKHRTISAKANCEGDGIRMADVRFLPHPVSLQQRGDTVDVTISGKFQPLYYGMEGALHCQDQKWTETISIPADENVTIEATVCPVSKTQGNLMSGQMQTQLDLYMESRHNAGLGMVSSLELGEIREPDPTRPSLILKRAGKKCLWELAKESGSTVEKIRTANDLQGEPEENRMLLIPIP